MALPTVDDVQAVEPVLTNMLVGYQQSDDRFVASRVFPVVPVDKDSGTYMVFTKKYWFLDEMGNRAPGGNFAQVNMGVSSSTYSTLQWAAESRLADEVRANSQVPLDLESAAVRLLSQRSLIRKERAFAADFMTSSVWSSDPTPTDWDDFTNGDPIGDVSTYGNTISDSTGQTPNTLVCGKIVHTALIRHPDILDRMKYVLLADKSTVEMNIAAVLGLQNYWVSKASYNSANEAASGTYSPIIDDDALLCVVNPSAGLFDATAGKTFVWAGGGGSGTIYTVRNDMVHADLIQIKEQWDQKAVATDLGIFFPDIV